MIENAKFIYQAVNINRVFQLIDVPDFDPGNGYSSAFSPTRLVVEYDGSGQVDSWKLYGFQRKVDGSVGKRERSFYGYRHSGTPEWLTPLLAPLTVSITGGPDVEDA